MTRGLGDDQITQAVALLPDREPERQRAEHTRARCHAAMSRSTRSGRASTRGARLSWRPRFEPAVVGLVSAIYPVRYRSSGGRGCSTAIDVFRSRVADVFAQAVSARSSIPSASSEEGT